MNHIHNLLKLFYDTVILKPILTITMFNISALCPLTQQQMFVLWNNPTNIKFTSIIVFGARFLIFDNYQTSHIDKIYSVEKSSHYKRERKT